MLHLQSLPKYLAKSEQIKLFSARQDNFDICISTFHPVLSYPNWSLYHIHPKLSIVSQLIKLLVHKIYCSWYQVPVYLWRIKLAGKPWNYLYYVVAFENVCNIFPGGNTVNCQNIMARVVAETYLTFPHSYMPNFWKRKSKGNLHIVG